MDLLYRSVGILGFNINVDKLEAMFFNTSPKVQDQIISQFSMWAQYITYLCIKLPPTIQIFSCSKRY